MAKILLLKLLEINPTKRLMPDKILKHPWITRLPFADIPNTYFEDLRIRGIKNKITEVIIKFNIAFRSSYIFKLL